MKPCNQCDIYGKGSLLGSLQESDLEKMNHNRRRFPMRKNQILFTTGQPLNGWYCVKKGKIRIYRVSSGGKEQTYRIAGPGDWIGHREMIEESDSHFNAVSLQESEICFIPPFRLAFSAEQSLLYSCSARESIPSVEPGGRDDLCHGNKEAACPTGRVAFTSG